MNTYARSVRVMGCAIFAVVFSSGGALYAADKTTAVAPVADSDTKPTLELIDKFSLLAGSTSNADSLVKGLRTGSPITLTAANGTPTTFSPATKTMGVGNVNIALSLAQSELSKLGISQPTPAQLQAALNGGAITTSKGTTTVPGVLALRSNGMGWGEIAHKLGFKLGEVVRSTKVEQSGEHGKGSVNEQQDKGASDHGSKSDKSATVAAANPGSAANPASNHGMPSPAGANAGHGKK